LAFGDGQDIKVPKAKNDAWTLPPSFSMEHGRLPGGPAGFASDGPGFLGVADLMTEIGHGGLLCCRGFGGIAGLCARPVEKSREVDGERRQHEKETDAEWPQPSRVNAGRGVRREEKESAGECRG